MSHAHAYEIRTETDTAATALRRAAGLDAPRSRSSRRARRQLSLRSLGWSTAAR